LPLRVSGLCVRRRLISLLLLTAPRFDDGGEVFGQLAAALQLPDEHAGVWELREQLAVRHRERRQVPELGLDRRVVDALGVELLLDVACDAQTAHALHVAGAWAEGEAVEHVCGALLLAQPVGRRFRRGLFSRRARGDTQRAVGEKSKRGDGGRGASCEVG
jgi:hypothetical protein